MSLPPPSVQAVTDELRESARRLLVDLSGDPDADFRPGQWESISELVERRSRVLVVQRTGWGKSAVYFIATRLLRDAGAGPTLLVSPLLALMRNQIQSASRMGVRALSINSANRDEWETVADELDRDAVDVLVISPERLANPRFRDQILGSVAPRTGLMVIDEAHCISDWGHDFRPDYRRIQRILGVLPRGVPVLGCTATANDRVVDDIVHQLGDDLVTMRGPLGREGLALQVLTMPSAARRLAWLARVVPDLPGTGIIYCLTQSDAHDVAEWLTDHGLPTVAYTGATENRESLEARLLSNEVKAVAATSALGMGFDKPDLAFVIHYQSPGSPITYYQQVGRAGRQLDRSLGVLLMGAEDEAIQDWFITTAFPSEEETDQLLAVLDAADGPVKQRELESAVNLKPTRMKLLLRNLEADGAIVKEGPGYLRTATHWTYDHRKVNAVTSLRRAEQDQMRDYASDHIGCRMAFLRGLLDDIDPQPCGICDICTAPAVDPAVDEDLVRRAAVFLRRRPIVIAPRRKWADYRNIPPDRQIREGRALGHWADEGWGALVRKGRGPDRHFDDELVEALAALVTETWRPSPTPMWITHVPSIRRPDLVADLARRLGAALGLPVVDAVEKIRETAEQRSMRNSSHQAANVRDAFTVRGPLPEGPVLLVDDTVESRWTITEVGARLKEAGCSSVYPLVLAKAGAG